MMQIYYGAVYKDVNRPGRFHMSGGKLASKGIFMYAYATRKNGEKIMRFVLKIFFAPIIVFISIFVWAYSIIIQISGIVMSLASLPFLVVGVVHFIEGNNTNGWLGLVIAFLLSPYGLPMLAIVLLGGLQSIKYTIQDKIYN